MHFSVACINKRNSNNGKKLECHRVVQLSNVVVFLNHDDGEFAVWAVEWQLLQ